MSVSLRNNLFKQGVPFLILSVVAVIIIVPFLIAFSMSLKDSYVFSVRPFFPENPTIVSYKFILENTPFVKWMLNSVLVSSVVMFLKLFLDSLAGYAFAKKDFPGRDIVFVILLSSLMIPFSVMLIPTFLMVRNLRMINTYAGLILPALGSPMGIFLMRQFIQTIPSELEDSARIDGASDFGIYWRIILPISRPSLAVLAIFTFMNQWTNFIWPLVVTTSNQMRTLPVGLATLQGQFSTNWGQVMAGALLAVIPITIVFLFFQRYFIEGMTAGAIKG